MGEGNGRVREALESAVEALAGSSAVYLAGAAAYHQAARWQMGPTGSFAAIWIAQC